MRDEKQIRSLMNQFETRSEDDGKHISGYFAVFNSNYEMWEGATESIDPHAFDEALADDIRCLIDHDSHLVIGRTKANTLTLKVDSRGLWGDCLINEKDQDALNIWERVNRGDVDQCSFGFQILDEETTFDGDKVHWTIKKVRLFEVSVCTFPAYEATSVSARKADYEDIMKRRADAWRENMLKKLRGE